jgi:hypothetical protein
MNEVPPRLLRDALRRTAATPASNCIDADTLAAWADGSLPRRNRAALESHAASCERCQALIAALTKIAPPAAAAHRWWLPTIGWLVPVAAAATALVLWIGVPERRLARPAPAPVGSAEPQVAATAPLPATSPSSSLPGTPRAQVDAPSIDQAEPRQRARAESGSAAVRAEQSRGAGANAHEPPMPPAAALGLAPLPASNEERAAARDARVDARAETRADAPAGAGASGSTTDPTSLQTQRLLDAVAPQARLDSAMARRAVQDVAKASAAVEIVSPDANVRWRINGTNVERSGDAGTTWQMQSTGASALLTSGAAPSRTVCWIVGAAGTVVRSVDGRSWQRLAFPDPIDLRAVRASDAAHAVVTGVDGRTFATSDGGQTWQPSGPR